MPEYDTPPSINWPAGFEQTPSAERERTTKFSANYRRTKRDVKKEMERMEVATWTLHDTTGSGGWPGVVVRWSKDGTDYAVACDHYQEKRSNFRAVYLWLNETRMRNQRPVVTGEDELAAARLPPGEGEQPIVAGSGGPPPHEVLEVSPDASAAVVRGAYRQKAKEIHGDTGGNTADMTQLNKAKEAMLDE